MIKTLESFLTNLNKKIYYNCKDETVKKYVYARIKRNKNS